MREYRIEKREGEEEEGMGGGGEAVELRWRNNLKKRTSTTKQGETKHVIKRKVISQRGWGVTKIKSSVGGIEQCFTTAWFVSCLSASKCQDHF